MKKNLVFIINILILIIVIFLLIFVAFKKDNVSISNVESKKNINNTSNKIDVVATIFPNYDFAKQIGKDKLNVKLLLASGVESHTYEPTPKDMIDIENSDIFIYTGSDFEPWAENIISSLNSKIEIIDTSKNISLIDKNEFVLHHYDKHHVTSRHHREEHHHIESSYDSHIWLNPQNAIIMIDDILAKFCSLDPENAEYYTKNATEYKEQIENLDKSFTECIEHSARKEIAFAGEFSYSYFIEKYGLDFVSVYSNCGEGEDPSIYQIKSVIDCINEHHLPVVFYEELSQGLVANMIEDETSAKSNVFYTIHNADIHHDSYVSLMNKNLENLKEALN